MILRVFPLLALTLLAACAANGPPGVSGPVRQLNIGKWTPAPGELAIPGRQGGPS